MSKHKLTYFNAAGRAEPVRIACFLSDVSFEDHRVDFAGFGALKGSGALPLGQVPVLEVDGFSFAQTSAMLRYVAKLGNTGLYPSDPVKALAVDSALDTFNDTLSHALTPSSWEKDMDKRLAMRAELVVGPMAKCFSYVEGLIAKFGGPFVSGDQLSIADLVIASQVLQIRSGGLDGVTAEHLAAYPHICALTDAYLADPRIAAYTSK